MHVLTRLVLLFWCALFSVLPACEFSNSNVEESQVERVLITDQSGKTWDITQAVVRYGFDPAGFKFGLGPFTVTPLMLPPAVAASDSGYPADSDSFLVIGVSVGPHARAYQLDDLLDVEVADDIVGSQPLAVIHRPLAGEPSVCARVLAGDTLTISASGWLYGDESVLFDYQTESMWYRLGDDDALTCIAGAHFDAVLPPIPSTVAPWNVWRASHPSTRFMLR